ncbi:DUF6495 family protein [Namhaeicola litoreus]|uniref:DUF6495 family protein n=1 Tax=Namhaeicola litoreus TaxID=1052145 RepID=A0ABW3Y3B3_9FLAO
MKYQQLTKEQLKEFHEEFAVFLASQQITKDEWEEIKTNRPEIAEEELNLFSDVVWQKVLDNVYYLEHFSQKTLNLFKCLDDNIQRIVVEVDKVDFDFLDTDNFNWFLDQSKDPSISYFRGQKAYSNERNLELFDLIQKGSVISKGELFNAVEKLL